jgi:hypothetical protein
VRWAKPNRKRASLRGAPAFLQNSSHLARSKGTMSSDQTPKNPKKRPADDGAAGAVFASAYPVPPGVDIMDFPSVLNHISRSLNNFLPMDLIRECVSEPSMEAWFAYLRKGNVTVEGLDVLRDGMLAACWKRIVEDTRPHQQFLALARLCDAVCTVLNVPFKVFACDEKDYEFNFFNVTNAVTGEPLMLQGAHEHELCVPPFGPLAVWHRDRIRIDALFYPEFWMEILLPLPKRRGPVPVAGRLAPLYVGTGPWALAKLQPPFHTLAAEVIPEQRIISVKVLNEKKVPLGVVFTIPFPPWVV